MNNKQKESDMFFLDPDEDFTPLEKEQMDAMLLVWEADLRESIRRDRLAEILSAHGLELTNSASPTSTASRAA